VAIKYMRKGQEYELTVEKTEFPGYGVSTLGDKKVYIKNALPGQKLLGRISKKKKSYAEASVLQVLEDVDYKIPNICQHFDECGGCSHQTISYKKQLEFKKHQVLDLLEEGGITGFEFLGIEGSPEELEYRNKMEFTFGDYEKGGELSLGMHLKGRSFGIVTVHDCRIVDADYRKLLTTVLEYFRGKQLPHYRVMSHEGYLRNLVIRKAKNTGEILINIVTTSQIDFDFSELTELLRSLPYHGILTGIIHTTNDSLSDMVTADKVDILYGRDYIIEKLLGLKFKITPFSFFQTNSKGAEKLYSLVRDFMESSEDKVVFDLYCGTGTIGQIVAPKAKKVIGVELVEEAVAAANENAKFNGLNNCTFIAGDVAKVIQEVKDKPDIIILDPPRAGVHPVALKYVMDFNAKDIIYVSCNPKSLVVDLKTLTEGGYKAEKVICKDMFPMTPHIETIVKLSKINN
jgi:tRNA (uracil-5-)-methyltransferase